MADKSTPLVLDALSRAVADPAGLPLYGGRKTPGLFPTTTAAKQAAQRCKDEGYLRVVRQETKGKSVQEVCTITEKGVDYVLGQVSPKQVLEDLVRALRTRDVQAGEVVAAARAWQDGLGALQARVEKTLQQIQKPGMPGPALPVNGHDAWVAAVVAFLADWQASGKAGDCPLPELYRRARGVAPALTVGHFHDGLRRLHEQGRVYLHPWTGPLYEIPEPSCALLVGHEIAYYASMR